MRTYQATPTEVGLIALHMSEVQGKTREQMRGMKLDGTTLIVDDDDLVDAVEAARSATNGGKQLVTKRMVNDEMWRRIFAVTGTADKDELNEKLTFEGVFVLAVVAAKARSNYNAADQSLLGDYIAQAVLLDGLRNAAATLRQTLPADYKANSHWPS